MRFFSMLVCSLLLVLAACGPAPVAAPAAEEASDTVAEEAPAAEATATDGEMVEEMAEPMVDEAAADVTEEVAEDAAAAEQAATEAATEPAQERPAWQQIALMDARTGEEFTLADYADKTVFVEPMATWCTNCRRQLENVRAARDQLGEDVVFIAISVETNLTSEQLAQYADSAGFDWRFAVATPEVLQELVGAFGQSITNPPSTPHFIIRADGSTTELATGIKSPEQIIAQISAAGG
jgi:cytochrome oxidase Cu insertion factor (SCO1/SenC/PrrC family)